MAIDSSKTNGSDSVEDDDSTAELETLSQADMADLEPDAAVKSEATEHTTGVPELDVEFGNSDETIQSLKSDLKSRAETIGNLEFEVEQIRSRWNGLEKEVNVLEEAMSSTVAEVKLAHEKQLHTNQLLKERDKEIELLRSQLLSEERSSEVESRSRFVASAPAADPIIEEYELASLVPLNGSASDKLPIKPGRVSLGSSPDNDIHIESDFISRHHAQIVSSSADSILGDLNSTNGTYVNSKRIRRHALRDGDWITIGKHCFQYVARDSGSSSRATT